MGAGLWSGGQGGCLGRGPRSPAGTRAGVSAGKPTCVPPSPTSTTSPAVNWRSEPAGMMIVSGVWELSGVSVTDPVVVGVAGRKADTTPDSSARFAFCECSLSSDNPPAVTLSPRNTAVTGLPARSLASVLRTN